MKKLLTLVFASVLFTACGAVSEKISGESKSNSESKSGSTKAQAGDTVLFKSGPVNYSRIPMRGTQSPGSGKIKRQFPFIKLRSG